MAAPIRRTDVTDAVPADPDQPPQIITVVDTEEEFDWSQPFDRCATGVSHLNQIGELQAVFDAQDVRPVYAVDFAVANQAEAIDALTGIVADGRALIGAHLHPWVTPPFVEEVCPRNSYPGNLPAEVERDKLAVLTNRIADAFGRRPTIYRAGRYGIGPNTFDILEELRFTVDLSPMPAFDYREDGGPDFSWQSLQPSWVGRSKRVLCIPNTSAFVGYLPRHNLRMLSVAAMHARLRALRLPAVFSRLGLVERIALSPEGYTLTEMRRLTRSLYRAGQRLFILGLHSPSVAPGHTPYVRDDADRRALLSTIGRYFDFFRRELKGQTTDPLTVRQSMAERSSPGPVRADLGAARRQPDRVGSPPETTRRASRTAPVVSPIRDADLPELAAFWNRHLNPGIPCYIWIDAFRHPWMPDKPNNGFLLRAEGRLVGALGAIYSRQSIAGSPLDFCNLTSLVVDAAHRARSMDMLSACLAQKNLCFTNFTPSPAVAKILRLLRFTELPSGEYIVPHLPWPPAAAGLAVIEEDAELDRRLTGHAAQLWRDHRGIPWLNRFAVGHNKSWCLVFWKPAVIKGVSAAYLLGISDTELLQAWHQAIGGHLLLRHSVLATRVDAHLLPNANWSAIWRRVTTPHLVRATPALPADQVSFLYSELAALPL